MNDPPCTYIHIQSYKVWKSVTTDYGTTYVHPCKEEIEKVIHFILNFISSNILTKIQAS